VRKLLAGMLLAGLAGWVALGAMAADPPVRAQSETPGGPPAIQLRRVQHADFVPSPERNEPIFILAIGSDARPDVCMPVARCLADSLHLIGINPKNHAATILGFPRDSWVPIPGVGTRKINESLHSGGPELVVRTIESLTGITIDYYLLASFAGVIEMVNGIGGVEVNIPYPMNDPASGAVFPEGPQVLSGREALAFSRNRKDTPEGDFSRSENQGAVILSTLQKLQGEYEEDPTVLFRWIAVGSANLQTDLALAEVFNLLLTGLTIDSSKVTNTVVPGSLGFAGEASVVLLAPEAEEIYADMRKDGLVG
jgi:polyisoprenyl-teichoic acid--peptidoglycan teichoic acid transferase